MASFIFGGNTGETPESVKAKRAIAAKLLTGTTPKNIGEGIGYLGDSLLAMKYDREAAEGQKTGQAAGAAANASAFEWIKSALGGGAPAAPDASAVPATAAPTVPATPAALAPTFTRAEAQYGLPANYLAQTANIESKFNPNAANPNSSAKGLFQFVDGTARQYGLTNPMDPVASTDAAARLAADNAKVLTRTLGRAPTAGELYLAHQQGAGGASKLLANPNARAIDVVGPAALRLNGGRDDMTAGEFARRWTSKLAANEADLPAEGAVPVEAQTGQAGFAVPSQPAMSGQTFDQIQGGKPLEPVFQSEGLSQPWMGSAFTPRPPAGMLAARAPATTMPPPRPADLPAPGAVEAIGQMPQQAAQPMPDLSNENGAGAREFAVAEGQARMGQPAAPQEPFRFFGQQPPAPSAAFSALPAQPVAAPAPVTAPQPAQTAPGAPAASAAAGGFDMAQAAAIMNNPWVPAGTKALVASALQARMNRDPMAQRLKELQVQKLQKEVGTADTPKVSLTPIYGTDKDGNTILLQPDDSGTARQTKIPEGVKIAGGIEKIDGGTEWLLYDRKTNVLIGREPKNLRAAESEKAGGKVEGETAATAKVGLNDAIAKADTFLGSIEEVRKHPGRDGWGGQGATAAWPIIGNGLPGTTTRDFVARVDQLKGQAFLEAFNQLKGGGAISEGEGKAATDALARLDRAQSREGFDAALNDLAKIIKGARDRARQKAGGAAAAPSTGGIDTSKPGSFRFNPSTGKMEPM